MCTKVVYLVFLMVFAEQTFCHHVGAAQYHPGSTIEIEGRVTHVFWQNPHVHFIVDVKDASGNVQEWVIESNSVSILQRMGIQTPTVWSNIGCFAARSHQTSAADRDQVPTVQEMLFATLSEQPDGIYQ